MTMETPPRSARLRGRRLRMRRLPAFSINRMIPNMLTLLALCAGMTAIRFAIAGKFEWAVTSILIAAILDGLDGRVARLLKSTSPLGAQLDSLADFISFGVAPAVVLYIWTMSAFGGLGWAIVLFYAMCGALRLARFNTQIGAALPPYAANFFTGVPAPAGAWIVLLPMYASFEWGGSWLNSPWLNAAVILGSGALMVSRVPTSSMKKFRVRPDLVVPTLIGTGLVAALLTTVPWPTLVGGALIYLATIPFTVRAYYRAKEAAERSEPPVAAAPTATAPSGQPPRLEIVSGTGSDGAR